MKYVWNIFDAIGCAYDKIGTFFCGRGEMLCDHIMVRIMLTLMMLLISLMLFSHLFSLELHVSQQVWLGMEKINGQYVWVDGSKHVPISEERWEGGGSPNQMYAYNTPPDHWQHAGTSNYNEILCEENYSNKVQGNILAPVIG